MKAAILVAGASALLASAKPINKRVMETEWVTDYVTVTVMAGEEEAQATDYVVLEAEPTTVTTTVKTLHTKTHTRAKATSSTVPAVVYSTVWVQAEGISTTSTSEAAAAATVVKVVSSQEAETTKAAATQAETTEAAATSAASDSSSGSYDLSFSNDYSTVMTNYHNLHRSNHSVSDLTWDSDLAAWAQTVADRCVFAHDTDVGGTKKYGQNIAAFSSSALTTGDKNKYGAVAVTDQWYNNELMNWSYYGQKNPPSGLDLDSYGHFTALVWKDTSTVGCGTAYCPGMYGDNHDMDAYYTVCNYYNEGNYKDQYGLNVLPPLGKKMVVV